MSQYYILIEGIQALYRLPVSDCWLQREAGKRRLYPFSERTTVQRTEGRGRRRRTNLEHAQARFISVGDSIHGWSFARSLRMVAAKMLPCHGIAALRTR
jgi:hypothetical protein